MRQYLVKILFLLWAEFGYAQTFDFVPASHFAGGISVVKKGEWSHFFNPALLATCERSLLSATYESRFAMRELSVQALSVAVPTPSLCVGASVSHFGYSVCSEMLVGISFAHTFDRYLTIGLQFDYYSASFSSSEGHKGAVVAQVGLLSELTPDLTLGFCVFNPTCQRLVYRDIFKKIPTLFSIGMQYGFSDAFQWLCQVDKMLGCAFVGRVGFEYRLVPQVVVQIGGYGSPFVPTLGCGVARGGFRLDVGFERHRVLGVTSVGTLRYVF
jgi:hypothetical protein